MDNAEKSHGVSFFTEFSINFGNDWVHSFLVDFFFEHFLQNAQDYLKLLWRVFRQLHIDTIRDAIGTFPYCINKLNKLSKGLLSLFVDFINFTIEYLIIIEICSILEKIDTEVAGRIEILHFNIEGIGGMSSTVISTASWFLCRDIIDHLFKFVFYFQNGSAFSECVIPEILNKQLGDDMKVFLIIGEDMLDQIEYLH